MRALSAKTLNNHISALDMVLVSSVVLLGMFLVSFLVGSSVMAPVRSDAADTAV